MDNILTFILFLGINLLTSAMSYKVLLIPQNIGSHYMFFGRMGTELANEGHSVLLLKASNAKAKLPETDNFKIRTYKVQAEVPFSNSPAFLEWEIRIAQSSSFIEWTKLNIGFNELMMAEWGQDCEDMFQEKDLYNYIKSQDYDIAILDPLVYTCTYAYTYKLGIPVVTFSIPFGFAATHIPALPSQTPSLAMASSDQMSFAERIQNAAIYMLDSAFLPADNKYLQKYVYEKPLISSRELLLQSRMWFYLHDDILTYPKPSMPYTVDFADIMLRDAQPLSKEFENVMKLATDQVIVVSMGSYFDHAPDEWLEKLCKAFKQVEYTLIWKSTQTPPCDLPSNIKVFKWIPQNDLLASPKVSLFVSHCGINSLIESIGHGVPVLGFPVGLDQPHNAHAVRFKKYGKTLDIFTASSSEIFENINEILADSSFRDNTQKAQKLLRNKPLPPGKRASFWIDHVTRFGADHLHPNSEHLSILQFYMFDIFFFLLSCLLLIVFGIFLVLYCTYRLCRRYCCKTQLVKNKKE